MCQECCARIIDHQYDLQAQQYAISSSDLQIRFYDDTSLRLVKGYHISTSQNCLQCYPDSDTMYSAVSTTSDPEIYLNIHEP